MPKVNYIYAELTQESQEALAEILPFRFPKHFGKFITLDWKVESDGYRDLIGNSYKLTVDTLIFDKYGEAIRVDLSDTGLRSVNKNPHITWSIAEEFEPYYSNYLLEVSRIEQKFGPIEIKVVVKDGLF